MFSAGFRAGVFVCLFVCPSVRLSVCLSLCLFYLCIRALFRSPAAGPVLRVSLSGGLLVRGCPEEVPVPCFFVSRLFLPIRRVLM